MGSKFQLFKSLKSHFALIQLNYCFFLLKIFKHFSNYQNQSTYTVQPAHALRPVDLLQPVHHAGVAVGRRSFRALQAQPRLHHPNRVRHGQRQDAGLGRGQHVQRRSQRLGRVPVLDPRFNRVVAETSQSFNLEFLLLNKIILTTKSRTPRRCLSPRCLA